MRQTDPKNIAVTRLLEPHLKIEFENFEYRLDGWGEADNYCQLDNNTFVFIECERSQKHPNTNVLKYWPFLEENNSFKLILFHYFFPENKAPKNRVRLCQFTASRIESVLTGRFQYVHLGNDLEQIANTLKEQKKGLMQKLLTGQIRTI